MHVFVQVSSLQPSSVCLRGLKRGILVRGHVYSSTFVALEGSGKLALARNGSVLAIACIIKQHADTYTVVLLVHGHICSSICSSSYRLYYISSMRTHIQSYY